MIITSSHIGRVGSITKVGMPEADDGAIKIPNSVLQPIPYPLQMPGLNGTVFSDSFITTGSVLRTNQVGITQVLGTLAAGLWKLNVFIDAEFNWTSGTLTGDATYQFQDVLTGDQSNLWFSPARVSRTIIDLNERVFLFKNPTLFQLAVSTTGVGQTTQLLTFTSAARLL